MIGTLIGGISAARAMRDYSRELDAEERRARRRRDRLLNEDPTQRADARHALQQLDRRLKQRTAASDSRAALTGGSPDAAAADRAAATMAMASATGAIAADASSRADRADADYEQRRDSLRRARRDLMARQAADSTRAGARLDGMLGIILGGL